MTKIDAIRCAEISTVGLLAIMMSSAFFAVPVAAEPTLLQSGPGNGIDRRVALTFDDLPMSGGAICNTDLVRVVTADITSRLDARGIPAAGLVTPGRECIGAALLDETLGRWEEIGATIGNHTATHSDLNTTSVRDYIADIEMAQRLIDAAVATDERWFRPPYLHFGDELRKKTAVTRYLDTNGYRVAPVTVDNQEWVYAIVYAHARSRGDEVLADRVGRAYVDHISASMDFYEKLSTAVFGREIPQVLLLHANSLNADYLDILLDLLEDRGYRFVGLSEAVSDPAYDRPDTYVGPRGLSWIQRWALAADVHVPDEPREAEWVAEALHAIQTGNDQRGTSQSTGNEGDGAVDGSRQQQVSATEAIAAASRAFSAAFVAGDTAAIRELYTEGAMLLPPERDVRGRDAIARYFAPGPRRRNLEHAMTSDDLGIEGNLAVDMGTWTNRWSLDGGEPRQASGRYLIVWRRGEDDRWRIEYDMWHRPTSR